MARYLCKEQHKCSISGVECGIQDNITIISVQILQQLLELTLNTISEHLRDACSGRMLDIFHLGMGAANQMLDQRVERKYQYIFK